MQKLFTLLFLSFLIIFNACHSKEKTGTSVIKAPEESQSVFPVTDFLKGQLKEIDSLPVTPLKTVTFNGKTDSTWLKRENIRDFAKPFLTPVIDSISMSPYFSGKSFLDQTVNAFTFSYDAKTKLPAGLTLRHWDVYIDPQKSTVQRIYLVKEDTMDVITQLTWQANQWCSIRTITQKPGKDPVIKEEKLTWDFDN